MPPQVWPNMTESFKRQPQTTQEHHLFKSSSHATDSLVPRADRLAICQLTLSVFALNR